MGLEIIAKAGPLPRELMLKLVCDADHGFLERADTFEAGGDFMAMRAAATVMGWKETYVLAVNKKSDGAKVGPARLFLCPECARKSSTKGETVHE